MCNTSDQFVAYKKLALELADTSSTSFWDLINCTPRCKFTKYVLKPMFESNYNRLLYRTGKTDGANIAVRNNILNFSQIKYHTTTYLAPFSFIGSVAFHIY